MNHLEFMESVHRLVLQMAELTKQEAPDVALLASLFHLQAQLIAVQKEIRKVAGPEALSGFDSLVREVTEHLQAANEMLERLQVPQIPYHRN